MSTHHPASDALVLFGATGDLARKKLFPALYHLAERGRLELPVVGVAKSDWDDDKLRDYAREAVTAAAEKAEETVDDAVLAKLLGRIELVTGDYADEATFDRRWLDESRRLAEAALGLFWDAERDAFFDTGADHEALIVRPPFVDRSPR